jgi:hypothetical protein
MNVRVWTPRWMQEGFSRGAGAQVQVLPCVRMRRLTWPLACMEIVDQVHPAMARARRLDISLVFPTPSSDRCASDLTGCGQARLLALT